MNKLYQRINWQNYPSDSTPLNESNLNKMDAAVDGIDDRVVTLDVTKLPVSTANTMVKDVTFNETTGVFTITKLNGTKVTVNTALEKIATNFRYDHSTQKLILTLIDGTTQEVDLSALLTQYEFLNSSTIQFTIDSSGKVKASVVNGSITGDMLEPNYLANVTLQASKADTSAKNAKESEEKAAEYAENAKNSADSAEPVASTATGTNPTIQDSTNAPFIYGKFKGYTLQDGEATPDNPVEINGLAKDGAIEVKTCGKNVFGGLALAQALVDSGSTNVVLDTDAKTVTFGHNENYKTKLILFKGNFKENTQYSLVLNGTHTNNGASSDYYSTNLGWQYTDGTRSGMILNNTGSLSEVVKSDANKSVECLIYGWTETGDTLTLNYEQCGLFEGVIALDEFTPYQGETTATIPTDAPLYEGDYIEVYADGSGKESHKMKSVDMGSLNWVYDDEKRFVASIADKTMKYEVRTEPIYCDIYTSITDGRSFESVPNFSIYGSNTSGAYVHDNTYTDATDFKNAVKGVMLVYELAEPTETPLTAEQVEQFKKLYTFEPVTNVLCDGEVEMRYYKANVNGETVGMLQGMVEKSNETVGMLQEQTKDFAKKSIYGDTTINVGRKEGSIVGDCSTAEGYATTASGDYAHAEGMGTTASGDYAHAEGKNTTASGLDSHSEGYGTTASGDYAHAEGMGTTASGLYSHVEGNGTIAHGNSQHVQGKYNVEDAEDKYAHIVGGGTHKERKNIHTLDWDGNAEFAGNVLGHVNGNSVSLSNITRYLGRIDLGMYATQNTYDFTSFAGYDRYTLVFKGQDANRSLFTRELLTIHNIEKNTSNVGKACLNISNNYTFEPWVEMYPSGNKTYIVVGITDTTGLTTLVSSLFVEVYGAMD